MLRNLHSNTLKTCFLSKLTHHLTLLALPLLPHKWPLLDPKQAREPIRTSFGSRWEGREYACSSRLARKQVKTVWRRLYWYSQMWLVITTDYSVSGIFYRGSKVLGGGTWEEMVWKVRGWADKWWMMKREARRLWEWELTIARERGGQVEDASYKKGKTNQEGMRKPPLQPGLSPFWAVPTPEKGMDFVDRMATIPFVGREIMEACPK